LHADVSMKETVLQYSCEILIIANISHLKQIRSDTKSSSVINNRGSQINSTSLYASDHYKQPFKI
jgi:hypothetical protein